MWEEILPMQNVLQDSKTLDGGGAMDGALFLLDKLDVKSNWISYG